MQTPASPGVKVMTQAALEAYQKQQSQERLEKHSDGSEDEEDDINYDSEEDSKTTKQTDSRKNQEAYIAGYRQQRMKITDGPSSIDHTRIPSLQGPWMHTADDGDEDDIPLAMLRARKQTDGLSRLAGVRSNPNLRASAQQHILRPGSAQGKPDNGGHLRLPAFAQNLPQDPFQDPYQDPFQDPFQLNQRPMFTGGLVGVIANEERAKASRRGNPSVSFQSSNSPTFNGFRGASGPVYMASSPYSMPMGSPGLRPQTSSSGLQIYQQMPQIIPNQTQILQTMNFNGQFNGQHQLDNSRYSIPQRPGTSGNITSRVQSPVPAYGGYAQSIPPAERSNVGMPSRYRPVTKS